MAPPDDEREWDDPPGVFEDDPAESDREVVWPTHGVATAAWAGWLALGYAVAETAGAFLGLGGSVSRAAPIAVIGIGLLLGVRLGGGDLRPWRQ
jgi:hypothetical protein